jgi:hypothetical protein
VNLRALFKQRRKHISAASLLLIPFEDTLSSVYIIQKQARGGETYRKCLSDITY